MNSPISRIFFSSNFWRVSVILFNCAAPHRRHVLHQHHLVHPDEREKGEFEVTFKAYRRHN